jgi:signal transduction histidine kinase
MKKKFSLASQVELVIGKRIGWCIIFCMLLISAITVYDLYLSLSQLRLRINENVKPIENFVVGQLMSNNSQSIDIKIENFNKNENAYKVEWLPSETKADQYMSWRFPFSWVYYYPLGKVGDYKFGYFKITGVIINDRKLVYDFFIRISILVLFMLILIFLLRPLAKKIPEKLFISPVNRFLDMMQYSSENIKEYAQDLPEELQELEKKILDLITENESKSKEAAIGQIASQVAHDIRSPLTTLNAMLRDLPQIPEEKRIILRNAATRINDIANNLLTSYKGSDTNNAQLRTLLIAPIIESMVSEKRIGFEEKSIELGADIRQNAYFVFANVELQGLKRVFSNLINNGAEAFGGKPSGKITLSLKADDEHIYMDISDNGCGIPAEKLPTIFEAKKTTKAQGSGIGLFHAKETIEGMQGTITIESTLGIGTTLKITLPRAASPQWFIDTISISSEETIAILDDDESIHGTWETRLKEYIPQKNIVHFRNGKDFSAWYAEQKNPEKILVLSDYELLGESKTGLDILELWEVNNAILITSHYEKEDIIARCLKAGIKLLPKNLVAEVPIRVEKASLPHQPPRQASPATPPLEGNLYTKADYILIDDDKLIHQLWAMCNKKGLQLVCFTSPTETEKTIEAYDKKTPIYIDSTLGNNIKGEDYAKVLYDKGFSELYLATGYNPDHFPPMPWIKGIVGKEPPFIKG